MADRRPAQTQTRTDDRPRLSADQRSQVEEYLDTLAALFGQQVTLEEMLGDDDVAPMVSFLRGQEVKFFARSLLWPVSIEDSDYARVMGEVFLPYQQGALSALLEAIRVADYHPAVFNWQGMKKTLVEKLDPDQVAALCTAIRGGCTARTIRERSAIDRALAGLPDDLEKMVAEAARQQKTTAAPAAASKAAGLIAKRHAAALAASNGAPAEAIAPKKSSGLLGKVTSAVRAAAGTQAVAASKVRVVPKQRDEGAELVSVLENLEIDDAEVAEAITEILAAVKAGQMEVAEARQSLTDLGIELE